MVALCGLVGSAWAQDSTRVDTARKGSFLVLPIVYFTPETQWAGGAGGVYTFRFAGEGADTQGSQVQFGGAYTQLKQVLAYVSGRVYWGQEANVAYGEVGYYIYNYFFFGVGNGPQVEELYGVTFPRVRLNYLRRLSDDWYGGLRYWYDGYRITEVADGGVLATGVVPGSGGGAISGLGLVANYDTRDNIFWPDGGEFLELAALWHSPLWGSAYGYGRFTADGALYRTLPWANHRVAVNYYTDLTVGEVPFYAMPMLGGPKKLRGYYLGRYLDRQAQVLQAEYRAPLPWRFALIAFAGLGQVGATLPELYSAPLRYTYGAGLRWMLDKDNRVNIRLDVGLDPTAEPAFYLTVGEAF